MVRVRKLAQVAQGGGRWSVPGKIQGQAGHGSEEMSLLVVGCWMR